MSVKHEWRKHEKPLYLPKNTPEIVEVPELKFLTLRGEGSPDSDAFTSVVVALYGDGKEKETKSAAR